MADQPEYLTRGGIAERRLGRKPDRPAPIGIAHDLFDLFSLPGAHDPNIRCPDGLRLGLVFQKLQIRSPQDFCLGLADEFLDAAIGEQHAASSVLGIGNTGHHVGEQLKQFVGAVTVGLGLPPGRGIEQNTWKSLR